MGCAQEEHSAGDFFEDISEVLRTHDGCIKGYPAFGAEHIFNHIFAELDGAVVADSDGEALFNMHFRAAPMRSGDSRGEAVQFFGHPRARLRRQCTDRAKQMRCFRNDIVSRTRRDFGDGDDRWIEHRNLACHHCLDCRNDFAGHGDGVDGIMRHRSVAARALDRDGQHVG